MPASTVAVGDVQGYAQMVDPATDEVIGGVGPPTIGTNWNELADGVLTLAGRERAARRARRGRDRRRRRRANAGLAIGDRIAASCSRGRPASSRSSASPGSARRTTSAAPRSRSSTPRRRSAVLGKEGVYDAISVVGDEGVAPSELRSVGRRGAARRRRGGHVDVGRRRGVAGAPGGAGVLPDRAARVRVRRAVRRLVHHLQHVLDHRRAAHARARAAASARRVAATGRSRPVVLEAFLVGVGRVGDRHRSWASASRSGCRGCSAAFNIDLPSTSLAAPAAHDRRVAPRRASASRCVASIVPARRAATVAPVQALREAGDSDGRHGARRAQARRRRSSSRCSASPRSLYGLFGARDERRVARRARRRGHVHRRRDAVAAGGAAGRGRARRAVAPTVDPGPARAGERDAEPAPHGVDGGRADDRARPGGDGRDPRGLAEGVVRRGAHRRRLKADFTLSTSSFTPFSPEVGARVAALPEVGTACGVPPERVPGERGRRPS